MILSVLHRTSSKTITCKIISNEYLEYFSRKSILKRIALEVPLSVEESAVPIIVNIFAYHEMFERNSQRRI